MGSTINASAFFSDQRSKHDRDSSIDSVELLTLECWPINIDKAQNRGKNKQNSSKRQQNGDEGQNWQIKPAGSKRTSFNEITLSKMIDMVSKKE